MQTVAGPRISPYAVRAQVGEPGGRALARVVRGEARRHLFVDRDSVHRLPAALHERRRHTPEPRRQAGARLSQHLQRHVGGRVIEKSPETGLYVGYVPGFPGAHSQGETLEELNENLKEVVAMLLEDGEPKLSTEFVGI